MDAETVMHSQMGLISRRQVLEAGADDNFIERMVRRNEWKALHPGVYVGHTGRPSEDQLRMGAVLYAWPAALAGESALVVHGVRNVVEGEVRIAVDVGRKVVAPQGVSIVRLKDLEQRVLWNRAPPRLRIEEAALEAASRSWVHSGEAGAVGLLADICQQRFSTPTRLFAGLESLPRLAGRAFIGALLGDVATGALSLLEHRYLTRVERAHGLPAPGGRARSGPLTSQVFVTCTTWPSDSWSSSTAGSGMSSRQTNGPTSSATSSLHVTSC